MILKHFRVLLKNSKGHTFEYPIKFLAGLKIRKSEKKKKIFCTLESSNTFVTHNEMRHYFFEGTLPFARDARTWTTVGTEFAGILMVGFVYVDHCDCTAAGRVFAREHDVASYFFHGQIAYIAWRRKKNRRVMERETLKNCPGSEACCLDWFFTHRAGHGMWDNSWALVCNCCKPNGRSDIVGLAAIRIRSRRDIRKDWPGRSNCWKLKRRWLTCWRLLVRVCPSWCWVVTFFFCFFTLEGKHGEYLGCAGR